MTAVPGVAGRAMNSRGHIACGASGLDSPGAGRRRAWAWGIADKGKRSMHGRDRRAGADARFVAAGQAGDLWLVVLERGGIAYFVEASLFSAGSFSTDGYCLVRPNTLGDAVRRYPC